MGLSAEDGRPLVSVVLTAYQQPGYLNEALRSMAGQTYRNIEIIVADDASGEEFTKQYELSEGARLLVHRERRGFAAITRNTGIAEARGKYVALLDQDDLFLPEKIARQVEVLEGRPEAVMTFCHYRHIDENGVVRRKQRRAFVVGRDPVRQMLRRNMVMCPSQVMMRRESLVGVGMFDERIRMVSDWDMWLRQAAEGVIVTEAAVGVLHRQHEGQWSRERMAMCKGSLAMMEKVEGWLLGRRPDLAGVVRYQRSRWMRELARVQLSNGGNVAEARGWLKRAIALRPLDWKCYALGLRAMVRGA